MNDIRLYEENGVIRAFRASDDWEIPIPKFPQENTDMGEWLDGLSLDALEAARLYYQDRWTWDDASDKYLVLVAYIASELDSRASLQKQGRTTLDFIRN
jgi:hypothetical protein